jgi:hypothetical protein
VKNRQKNLDSPPQGMCSARSPHHVRLPPVCPARLLDHLGRLEQEHRGDREAERLGGLEVDDKLKLHGLLDGQVRGLRAPEDLVHIDGAAPHEILEIQAVAHQAASFRVLPRPEHRWQPVPQG